MRSNTPNNYNLKQKSKNIEFGKFISSSTTQDIQNNLTRGVGTNKL